jgi:ribonuclease HI
MNVQQIKSILEKYAHTYKTKGDFKQLAAIMALRWIENTTEDPCNDTILQEFISTLYETPKLQIFCDGSCLKNGGAGAAAGYGIYITNGMHELHRYSARVPADQPQTNQRAELLALQYALNYMYSHKDTLSTGEIYTDSKYALQCLSVWGPVWKASGWLKYDKKPIQHLDIIQPSIELWDGLKDRVSLHHVPAHTNGKDALSKGNSIADALAKEGAESL